MMNIPLADGDAAENVRGPVSRRALVAGLAGALGATAAATVGTAAPAEAANPPVLLSQDNTGPSAHRTAIFVPNNTEVASLGDSSSTFHNVFLGVYGVGATIPGGLSPSALVLATAQNNLGVYVVAAVPSTSTGTVKLTLNKAAGTASAPKTAIVAWFVVN